ncbi:MAG: hypothetical protein AB7F65_06745 [Dehalococcoidia bacterium]
MTTEIQRLDEIATYLRALVSLIGSDVTQGMTQKEKIERLVDAGLESPMISQITGYPMTTVSPVVSKYRKSSGKVRGE